MKEIDKILKTYNSYHPNPKPELIERAYEIAKLVYFGEKRTSGSEWLEHALGVAKIVADLKMDTVTICTAILHDAYKFGLTPDEVEKEINPEVRQLLDNLEAIKKIKNTGNDSLDNHNYSDYLRRLILSTSTDARALVIRLAEKLNGLETLNNLPNEIKNSILDKAMTIYAPLADQIGVYDLRWRIEDLAFRHKDPEQYVLYENLISKHPFTGVNKIQEIINTLEELLRSESIIFNYIYGRTKRIYSMHKKIDRYTVRTGSVEESLKMLKDIVAFRIITNSIDDCYRALSLIHATYKHIPEDFDDYIAKPKSNGYKSIQTTVELEPGHFAEIQIRTQEMHDYNEWGPASHFFYKMSGGEAVKVNSEKKIQVLKQLLSWKEQVLHDKTGANIEEIEDYIFVFTPKGDIIELPKESTPVDFAYKIHTTVGDKIGKALVNKKLVSLDYKLKNGDIVEIQKDKNRQSPNRDWLDFVKSKEARIHIKKVLNREGILPK